MELDISFLAKVTGDYTISKRFLKASQVRKKAIESIFWNAQTGQWYDYWVSNSKSTVLFTHLTFLVSDSHDNYLEQF